MTYCQKTRLQQLAEGLRGAVQISVDTKDVFIEVTGTDRHKADIVLATLCAMFSEHCAQPFEVEPVEVVDALGNLRGESHLQCCLQRACLCSLAEHAAHTQLVLPSSHLSHTPVLLSACCQPALWSGWHLSASALPGAAACLDKPLRAVTPSLETRVMEVELAYINRYVGAQLGAAAIADLLSRMALDASASESGSSVTVRVPPTRSDILHPCDVVEVRWLLCACMSSTRPGSAAVRASKLAVQCAAWSVPAAAASSHLYTAQG